MFQVIRIFAGYSNFKLCASKNININAYMSPDPSVRPLANLQNT